MCDCGGREEALPRAPAPAPLPPWCTLEPPPFSARPAKLPLQSLFLPFVIVIIVYYYYYCPGLSLWSRAEAPVGGALPAAPLPAHPPPSLAKEPPWARPAPAASPPAPTSPRPPPPPKKASSEVVGGCECRPLPSGDPSAPTTFLGGLKLHLGDAGGGALGGVVRSGFPRRAPRACGCVGAGACRGFLFLTPRSRVAGAGFSAPRSAGSRSPTLVFTCFLRTDDAPLSFVRGPRPLPRGGARTSQTPSWSSSSPLLILLFFSSDDYFFIVVVKMSVVFTSVVLLVREVPPCPPATPPNSPPPKKQGQNPGQQQRMDPPVLPVSIIASFNKLLQTCLPRRPPRLFWGGSGAFGVPLHPSLPSSSFLPPQPSPRRWARPPRAAPGRDHFGAQLFLRAIYPVFTLPAATGAGWKPWGCLSIPPPPRSHPALPTGG